MINRFKNIRRLLLLLLFLLAFIFSHGQDTLVKKRYLDSVKNQLAIYTVTSYKYLNMYDKSENDKLKLKQDLNLADEKYKYISRKRHRENLGAGLGFLIIMSISFVMVIKLSK
jgi:hypothetical protein